MDSQTHDAVEAHDIINRPDRRSDGAVREEENYKSSSQPHSGDGASPGKIFIGGLARETTTEQFLKHFGKYGEIVDSVIMKDRNTGQPRGFGFVTYAEHSVVDTVIEDTHIINGKQVEIKRTIPRGSMGSKDFKTKKIFVGGIPTTVNGDEFSDFFSQFGEVKEHQIMRDHSTGRSRGFGFITFDTEQAVDSVLDKGNKLEFAGAQVEIKKAEPRKQTIPQPTSKRYNDSRPANGSGYEDSYGGFGGGSYGGAGGYRSATAAYAGRGTAYGGYGGNEFGGYGSAGGGYGSAGGGYGVYSGASGGMGAYRGESSVGGYGGRYGGDYGRGYDLGGGGYGGAGGESYGGGYGSAGGGYGSGSGSGYDTGFGGAYGGEGGASFYGTRGGYGGGAGSGRYHPYGR